MSGLSGGLIEGKASLGRKRQLIAKRAGQEKNYAVSFLLHQTKNKSVNQSNEVRQSMRRQLEKKNETHRRVD